MAKQPNENKDTPNVNLLKFQQELEELAKEVLAMEGKGFFAKLGLGKKNERGYPGHRNRHPRNCFSTWRQGDQQTGLSIVGRPQKSSNSNAIGWTCTANGRQTSIGGSKSSPDPFLFAVLLGRGDGPCGTNASEGL